MIRAREARNTSLNGDRRELAVAYGFSRWALGVDQSRTLLDCRLKDQWSGIRHRREGSLRCHMSERRLQTLSLQCSPIEARHLHIRRLHSCSVNMPTFLYSPGQYASSLILSEDHCGLPSPSDLSSSGMAPILRGSLTSGETCISASLERNCNMRSSYI